jgi:serine/threonine-protein kinase
VVHRDLKPGNVLLVGSPGEDLVKILDFGVAKLLEGDGGPSDLSAVAGYALGTPEYMAPEQARCERIDARTDIYAVGVLLYEMLAGRLPFQAEGDLAILHKHIEETPRGLRSIVPEVSPELEAATLRALEKNPDRRWQSAADFSLALGSVPEGGAADEAVPRAIADRPSARVAAGRRKRATPPPPPPADRASPPVADPRERMDTPGMPTIAARPVALARARDGSSTYAPPVRRTWRRVALVIALAVVAGAAGAIWYAANTDRLDIAWPSWLPWA